MSKKHITIRLEPDVLEKLEKLSKKESRTRSNIIQLAVAKYLKREEK